MTQYFICLTVFFVRKILGLFFGIIGVILVVPPVSADTTGVLLPTSDGTYAQWTPKSGSTHYTQVDESSCNGTTDYNSETTTAQRDSYGINISSIPNGSRITQIDITPCASKIQNGGSNSTMNVFYRLNGANSSDAGNYSVSGTTPAGLSTTTYSSLSINKSSSTTLEIGSVHTAGSKGVRLGRIATVLTYTSLSSPSALSASPVSSSQIDLSWTDNSTIEDGFKIERSLNGSSGWIEVGTNAANDNTFSNSGLSSGTTYYYRVYAYNSGGNSGYSNTTSTTTFSLPAAPTSLTAVPTTTSSANLAWTDNATNETGYRVERSLNGVNGWTQRGSDLGANSTAFTDTGLTYGQSYFYRVYAFNSGGNSGYSNVASFNALIPVAPTNVTLTTPSCGIPLTSMNLSWTDNSFNENGFNIEQSLDGISYTGLATAGANVTSHDFTGTECDYRIRAFNGFGFSPWAYVDIIQ